MSSIPRSTLDTLLTLQLAVAWAGEADTDPPRLGWWRTALVDEFGGKALFREVLPRTWPWVVFQGAREAARRQDEALRERSADPDEIITLFHLGYRLDERLDDHLRELKRSGRPPEEALPELAALTARPWSRSAFTSWLGSLGSARHELTPIGRRLQGEPPVAPELRVTRLTAALLPLADAWPMPYLQLKPEEE